MNLTIKKIKKQISKNFIILYMKGSPKIPLCGFSAKVSKIISTYNIKFAYIDVLDHQDIRLELPIFSQWPTFPQLWISGKLIGGCDIVTEMHKNNTLFNLLKK
ncbi:Grx4 family monothiol glutaredoxin [Sodalis-like secondary symbiont of Drepanosiphum platanoidis]|uniref:Grx4 family monothiol glutaredoxin n=1 Tax=Sodalis-like secondary symbiont of Drepanosiphum platanoidis TaxID=2994493 RepID=UPI0034648F13